MEEGNAEERSDYVGEAMAERGSIDLDTGIFNSYIYDTPSTGFRVYKWAKGVGIRNGTDNGSDQVTVVQNLTPEQARELSEILLEAADEVEAMQNQDVEDTEEEQKSFLRSLLS
jgi:hypothetical protein